MGGVDKGALHYRGVPLLERSLRAVRGATRVVVVGGTAPGADLRARFADHSRALLLHTAERPAGGGPAAAVAAGLSALSNDDRTAASTIDLIAVLACDVPGIEEGFTRLSEVDGPAIAVDAEGRRQYLLARYSRRDLVTRLDGDPSGWSMRRLVDGVELAEIRIDAPDVDTWEDAERLGVEPGASPSPSRSARRAATSASLQKPR